MKGLDDEGSIGRVANPVKPKEPSKYTLPTGYLSNSQIEMYLRCPKQYEFRYILGVVRPPNVSMAMGTAVHAAVEAIHQVHITTGDYLDVDSAKDVFSDSWDAVVAEADIDVDDEEEVAKGNTKDIGVRLVDRYRTQQAPQIRAHSVEERVEGEVGGVPILGYIDLIQKGDTPQGDPNCACGGTGEESKCDKPMLCSVERSSRVVVDNKVVGRAKRQSDADNSLQLSGYALLKGVRNVRFDCLVKNIRTPKIVALESVRSDQDLAWYKEVVTGVADGITRGYFPACAPDTWCCNAKFCGFWEMCRGKKK